MLHCHGERRSAVAFIGITSFSVCQAGDGASAGAAWGELISTFRNIGLGD